MRSESPHVSHIVAPRPLIEAVHGHVFDHARPQWLTGGWVGSEIIRGAFLEPKVDGPSMLGIGRPDRHALPRITLVEIAPTTTRAPSRASGFVHRPFPDIRPGGSRMELMRHVSESETTYQVQDVDSA